MELRSRLSVLTRSRRSRRAALLAAALAAATGAVSARVYLTQQQAIDLAFPPPHAVERRTLYLSDEQAKRAAERAGVPVESRVVPYYVGTLGGKVDGYAYFDTHLVRTLPETILILLAADARIRRIDIVSFDEPEDYRPSDRWLGQFPGRSFGDELDLQRGIRSLTGATLSARAVTEAARRVLALHLLYVAPPSGAGRP
jgi:hypothetical protein